MSGSPPACEISVVICTRNRASALDRVLGNLSRQDVPGGLIWEVVVVDNGSSDSTPETLRENRHRLPLVMATEPEAGVSHARNLALSTARGKYLCWIDDDVVPCRGWLKAWHDAFVRYPEHDYFAGRVLPVLEGTPPAWFSEASDLLSDLVARRDLGPEPRELGDHPDDFPMGACYAVRATAMRKHRFDPRLGVSPRFRRLGEETAILRAIRAAGGKGAWIPAASVDHILPASRQTLDYILTYQLSVGETWAALTDIGGIQFMGQPLDRSGRTIRSAPLWLWRLVAKHWLSWRRHKLRGPTRETIIALKSYGYYRGALDYLVRGAGETGPGVDALPSS